MKDNVQVGCLRGFSSSCVLSLRRRARPAPAQIAIKAQHDQAPSIPPPEKVSRQGTLDSEEFHLHETCCLPLPSTEVASLASVRRNKPPSYASEDPAVDSLLKPEVLDDIDATIDELNPELRQLSLAIWDEPELAFKEHRTHDKLTSFMAEHGFEVTRNYLEEALGFKTAWRAEYTHGEGGRVIGLQSEMDALPNIGHACGHNLIAISGVAVALGLKAALERHDISGKIILLGTPAEEHGGGKIALLKAGAYREMNVCLMAHPGPGAPGGTVIQPWIAVSNLTAEFSGRSAHAAYSPWEGLNALDAAVMAYTGVSVLRQQMQPNQRVHGVIIGNNWEPNVIPDYSKIRYGVRAPTWAALEKLIDRVKACFTGAALATECEVKIEDGNGYRDCRQNATLGDEYVRIAQKRYGLEAATSDTVLQASTDFGDISYALPTIQAVFTIPVIENGSNHTKPFAESARTPEAHEATITISKVLGATALRVLTDETFYNETCDSFAPPKVARGSSSSSP